MINGRSVLAIVPARGGSKGVPRKNIKLLNGKPLIAWTIIEAKKSKYIDRCVVSTEDEEIMAVSRKWGADVPFVRPEELAGDETSSIDVVIHSLKELPGYDYVVLLQPTSPMRTAEDIDNCIEQCAACRAKGCVSVTEASKSPYWMFTVDERKKMKPVVGLSTSATRRQDLPQVFELNGAVYVSEVGWLLEHGTFLSQETIAYEMSKANSIDIDWGLDFELAELLIKKRANEYE